MVQRLHEAILHLGSNLGNRIHHLKNARNLIERDIGKIDRLSAVYETKAWGKSDQNDFLNQVTIVSTELLPDALLNKVNAIESEMGRIRGEMWTSRLIDIDILFYDDLKINSQLLKIPHPHIEKRNFVLIPLNEIRSDYIHPVCNKTINELMHASIDHNAVTVYKPE